MSGDNGICVVEIRPLTSNYVVTNDLLIKSEITIEFESKFQGMKRLFTLHICPAAIVFICSQFSFNISINLFQGQEGSDKHLISNTI